MKTWTTKNGVKIPINQIEDMHLYYILRGIITRARSYWQHLTYRQICKTGFSCVEIEDCLPDEYGELENEAIRRNIIIKNGDRTILKSPKQ